MPFFYTKESFDKVVAKRTTETCDQIIAQMGAELHDDLIQKLSVFRLYIDRIERSCADPGEVEMIALKMRTDFEQVVTVVRNISRRLLPAGNEDDMLSRTLEMLCQNMEHPGTGHIHFSSEGAPVKMDPGVEMNIFRIVQELIHNAFKHSAAWHIWVRLLWSESCLNIEVEDDGSGFSKIPEFIERLKRKNNTLKMRTSAVGGTIKYEQGAKGLLAKLSVAYEH